MSDDITWNNSNLSTLEMCGERFRRKVIERDPSPPNPRMIGGTAVHRVAAMAHMRQLQRKGTLSAMKLTPEPDRADLAEAIHRTVNQALPSPEEAGDIASQAVREEVERGVQFSVAEREEGIGKAIGKTIDYAVDVSRFYVRTVAPAVNPVAVERRIVVKPKDSDIVIHGTMDLIDAPYQDPEDEVIRDQKTSQASPPRDRADKSQQLTMYHMLRTAETGREPKKEVLDYLVRTPARGDLKHVPLETSRTMEDVQALVNRINTAVEAVEKGVFVPAHPESWSCSENWCEYFTTCKYVFNGRRRE